jgi:hypothetical protein
MDFEGNDDNGCAKASVLQDAALQATMQLCAQAVLLVDWYTYLGIEITKSLSYQDLLGPRVESGHKTIHLLQAFFACPIIPMSLRWIIIQVVVMPRLLYRAEIYGMCRALMDAMQRHLNHALRCILGIPHWKSMSSFLLWKEMWMKPICAIAAGRRTRAYVKCFELKTWVNKLVKNPLRVQQWTWVSGTTR